MVKFKFGSVAIALFLLIGCSSQTELSPTLVSEELPPALPEATRPPVPAEILNAKASELCNKLGQIKRMSHKDPAETDPVYEALMAKGDEAFPCLIEKISDATPMKDPRQAPVWQHYAIGDTAVFILVRSINADGIKRGELLKEMLPQKYRKEWETNGVYAYFNYVSEPVNRKALQSWWKRWIRENHSGNGQK